MDKSFSTSLKKKEAELKAEREALISELEKGNSRLTALNGAINGIEQLLNLEPKDDHEAGEELTGLKDILPEIMADGKIYSVDEIIKKLEAKGVKFGDKSPKKAVGFTLLGLSRGKNFKREDGGNWRYVA